MSADAPAEKKAASREHFDRWSDEYEHDRVSRWLRELQLAALGALAPGPDDQLLDVGCGSGAAVRAAAATVDRAVGVDLSPGMIDRLIMRVLDQVLRRTQRSHVGCQRSSGLAHLLTAAGFGVPTTRPLFHGFFAIVAACNALASTGC